MYLRNNLEPEAAKLASEAFNRSWQFIERDPLLAGEDREAIQEQLAHLILRLIKPGETNFLLVANRAIGALRQQYDKRRVRGSVEEAA